MSAVAETWYPVSWLGIRGDRYILEFQERPRAEAIAVALAEIGRKLVQLHEPYQILPDEELREKLRARMAAVLHGEAVDWAIREVAG